MNMKNISISPATVRGTALLALGVFVVIAGVTFYNMASIPTDENVFMTSPSRIMITAPIPARLEGLPRPRVGKGTLAGSSQLTKLEQGDLLTMVEMEPVRTIKASREALAKVRADSVTVRAYRASADAYLTFVLRTEELRHGAFTELPPSVIIISVLPGGASDRAGMRVGDVISRINGVGFTDAQDADATLRRGKSGTATLYEGFRGTDPIVLQVKLTQFGFPLSLLIFSLTGIAYMLFGAFLINKRPDLVSARTIGWQFLGMGFVISVLLTRREPDPTLFVIGRLLLGTLALYFGTAAGLHSSTVFPLDRTSHAHRRWIIPGLYLTALLSPLTLLVGQEPFYWTLYMALLVVAGIITKVNITPLQPEQKRMVRSLRWTVLIVNVIVVALTIGLAIAGISGFAGFVGILLLGIPLSYLYIIVRYQLIDIDFRIRRNVQYTALSWGWGILVGVLFIRLLFAIPDLPIAVPGITVTGLSVEIDPAPASPEDRVFLERLMMLAAGALVWINLWYLRKWGQAFIDRKYYRTQFDYRRAAASLAEVLSSRLSMNDIARGIVEALVDLMRIRRAGLLVFRNGKECCCEAVAGLPREAWEGIACTSGVDLAAAIGSHTPPVRVALLPAAVASLLGEHGFQVVVPIRSHDRLVGALLVGEKLADTSFGEEDLAFLSGVAKQSAVSIDNAFLYEEHAEKERMRHELNIARRIQLSSLPSTTPEVPGLDIAGVSIPAQEVGGDFYDYLGWNGKELMVVVGDVSGKGTSAALYMSKVQGILRSLYGFDSPPREGFIRANRLLCSDLERSSFVTALGARYVAEEKRFTLVRAGHLPLYHYHAAEGRVELVLTRGLGLGLNDAGVFARELEGRDVGFAAGDVMLFITDGVTEARNASGEEYGDARVGAILQAHAGLPATAMRDAIAADVRAFGAGLEQHDDQTIVVVKAV